MTTPNASLVVAIDGPSGSGKSSVSRAVARRLGVRYLDTGAMYRALTWWCREQGIDLHDVEAVAAAARSMPLEISTDPDAPYVRVGGVAVDAAIREPSISTTVSLVATNLGVREELVRRQRAIIEASRSRGGIVAEGRDITSVVAPDAQARVLLVASEQARLARRARELYGRADDGALAVTHDQVVRRDRQDATVADFLSAADGVVTVDTSDLDVEQAVQAVLEVVTAGAPSALVAPSTAAARAGIS